MPKLEQMSRRWREMLQSGASFVHRGIFKALLREPLSRLRHLQNLVGRRIEPVDDVGRRVRGGEQTVKYIYENIYTTTPGNPASPKVGRA